MKVLDFICWLVSWCGASKAKKLSEGYIEDMTQSSLGGGSKILHESSNKIRG